MTDTQRFLWGFGGSVAVEVVTLYQIYNSKTIDMPDRYKRFGFWVVRFALAVIAGGIAVAYDLDNRLLAANIGAATPSIIQVIAQGFKPAPGRFPQAAHNQGDT
jgi:hypothetical protein